MVAGEAKTKSRSIDRLFYYWGRCALSLVVAAAAFGAATARTPPAFRRRSGSDCEPLLLRPIVDIVDGDAAERFQLLIKIGMNLHIDIV